MESIADRFERVAIVHDWLTGMRGGEKVLLEFCRLFPRARIHTLLWNRSTVSAEIEARVESVSFLDRLPGKTAGYRNYLPLFPRAVRSLDVGSVDLVLSSSHAVAKGVRVPAGALHVSYVHTPMRYLWDESGAYFRFGRGARWKRAALAALKPYLRRFDVRSAAGVDRFIANSATVASRIKRCYGREAEVVHPPVDTDFFVPSETTRGERYVVVSSLEPYKRIDLAVEAFNRSGKPLLIAGSGTQRQALEAHAADNVTFLGRVSDEKIRELYQTSRALVFPGLEDFGMTPVEAQACGCPVICFGEGGAAESVKDGETGLFFPQKSAESLAQAVREFESRSWDRERIRGNSLRFSRRVFQNRMRSLFEAPLAENDPREIGAACSLPQS